jgi:hypothetical protein
MRIPQPSHHVHAGLDSGQPRLDAISAPDFGIGRKVVFEPAQADQQDIAGFDLGALFGQCCLKIRQRHRRRPGIVEGDVMPLVVVAHVQQDAASGDHLARDAIDAEFAAATPRGLMVRDSIVQPE